MKRVITPMLFLCLAVPAAAQDDFFEPQSSLGGYGELHYNADQTNNSQVLDFHRFVLFYGYEWTPTWSFYSEVELEHNFVKNGQGELELEQAHVDFHPNSYLGLRAGVVLAPVGIINLTHEPPTFLSVERPDYAKVIIPTTWFGNGATVYGAIKNFQYNVTLMEGLNGDKFKIESGIRSGRQKGYKADAQSWMTSVRLDYTGLPGTSIGFSYTSNEAFRVDSSAIGVRLFEVHARTYSHNIYSVFEYGDISYSDYDVNKSKGYYFDLGYNIAALFGLNIELIPWLRWSDYNTADAMTSGEADKLHHYKKWLVGLALKPINQVVFKIDYGVRTRQADDSGVRLLNVGAGYMF